MTDSDCKFAPHLRSFTAEVKQCGFSSKTPGLRLHWTGNKKFLREVFVLRGCLEETRPAVDTDR